MDSALRHCCRHRLRSPPWNDRAPVRQELFGVENYHLIEEQIRKIRDDLPRCLKAWVATPMMLRACRKTAASPAFAP
ncbi:MAG: hypothetical protein NVS9B10_23240 [Nevskia sp.]